MVTRITSILKRTLIVRQTKLLVQISSCFDLNDNSSPAESTREGTCLNGRFIHEYMSDYALDFWDAYHSQTEHPLFAYIHFNEAHVKDQFVVNIIDDSTLKVLSTILTPEVIMIILVILNLF